MVEPFGVHVPAGQFARRGRARVRSGRVAVLVDESAEDVDAFDRRICVTRAGAGALCTAGMSRLRPR